MSLYDTGTHEISTRDASSRALRRAAFRIRRPAIVLVFLVLVVALVKRDLWGAGTGILAAVILLLPLNEHRVAIGVGLAAASLSAAITGLAPGLSLLAAMIMAFLRRPPLVALAAVAAILPHLAQGLQGSDVPVLFLRDAGLVAVGAWMAAAIAVNGDRALQRALVRRGVPRQHHRDVARDLARAALTERRLLEVAANLRATQEQLEVDVRQRQALAEQLTIALQRADSANQAKSAFLAVMSHELRTPLNSIIGFSALLLRQGGTTESSRRMYLERINRNGTNLLALINDILDLSRIEAGKMPVVLQEIDVAVVVREMIDLQPAAGTGVEFALDVPIGQHFVVTDPERLRQVLVNLVSNALKFTSQGRVAVRLVLDDDRRPSRIEVQDTGIGIAKDRLEAIFEPFEQADNTTSRTFGGTGLGLAISRQLCAMLNATLTVESTVGFGTTFAVHLPEAPVVAITTPADVHDPSLEQIA